MSYLKIIKESLKDINELCDDALKEDDNYEFYIKEIRIIADNTISDFESLIYELKNGEEKLTEATKLFKNTLERLR